MAFEVVSIGDIVYDVYLGLHDAALHCRVNNEDCELCLRYGEKILVDNVNKAVGGNAANNAIGLTKLGFKGGLLTIHGDDSIGKEVTSYLETQGVDRSLVTVAEGTATRYSTIINFSGQRTALEYQVPRDYHLPSGGLETQWLYLSSVGSSYESFFAEVANYLDGNDVKLAFAPGSSQLKNSKDTYQHITALSDLFFLNKEEAMKMLGRSTDQGILAVAHIKDMLSQIYDLGPKVVALTDGKNGSYVYDGASYYHLPILEVQTVESTGAGDAYATGFMAAQMKGLSVSESMKWGTLNSAAVVQQIGPQAGLLTLEQMKQQVSKHSELEAKLI